MILTLTANPSVDLNFTADRLAFDDRAYIQSRSEAPGGRGINASSVLQSFGVPTVAIAVSGGNAGKRFEELLRGKEFTVEVVRIRGEIRTNYAITDRQGLTVKLDERGPVLNPEDVKRLEELLDKRMAEASWLMLCGSLPPGVPVNFYRRLIEKAHKSGVKTLLDSHGSPLLEGLDAHPSVVTPNQREAEFLLNRALITRNHFFEAARRILAMGAESVILSLGNRGVVAANGESVTEVIAPRIDAVCPIGSGDALNAAFIWAMTQEDDFENAARWGVAAGSASARLPGLSFANLEQTKEIFPSVEIRVAKG